MSGHAIDYAGMAGAPASASMTCPKCGFVQPEGAECISCGVFVAKFVESSRRAEEARHIQASVAERQQAYVQTPVEHEDEVEDEGFFTPEQKGIDNGMAGGIAMMVIAAVWFGAGYLAGVIFFYPPILFLIGVFAFLKGLFTGNVAGE